MYHENVGVCPNKKTSGFSKEIMLYIPRLDIYLQKASCLGVWILEVCFLGLVNCRTTLQNT